MPKDHYTKRSELICGKIEQLMFILRDLKSLDGIDYLDDIQHDANRMEAKLVSRKDEVVSLQNRITELESMLSAAPTPAPTEKVDLDALKQEAVKMWSPSAVASEAIKAVIDHLAARFDFVPIGDKNDG